MASPPSAASNAASATQITANKAVVLFRGLTMGCGVCGQRKLFRRWVLIVDDCPRCGLHFERVEGHWMGSIGMNTALSFGVILGGVVAFFVITYPDIPVGPWVFGVALIGGLIPVLLQPMAKTFWTAIDLLMRPLEPDEVRPRDQWTPPPRS